MLLNLVDRHGNAAVIVETQRYIDDTIEHGPEVKPGVREGFGINVIEAASMGTPAVGYNIHGLRDSIRDGYSGLLASGVDDAAERALSLLGDSELYKKFSGLCKYVGDTTGYVPDSTISISCIGRQRMGSILYCCLPYGKAGGLQILRCKGIEVK